MGRWAAGEWKEARVRNDGMKGKDDVRGIKGVQRKKGVWELAYDDEI